MFFHRHFYCKLCWPWYKSRIPFASLYISTVWNTIYFYLTLKLKIPHFIPFSSFFWVVLKVTIKEVGGANSAGMCVLRAGRGSISAGSIECGRRRCCPQIDTFYPSFFSGGVALDSLKHIRACCKLTRLLWLVSHTRPAEKARDCTETETKSTWLKHESNQFCFFSLRNQSKEFIFGQKGHVRNLERLFCIKIFMKM